MCQGWRKLRQKMKLSLKRISGNLRGKGFETTWFILSRDNDCIEFGTPTPPSCLAVKMKRFQKNWNVILSVNADFIFVFWKKNYQNKSVKRTSLQSVYILINIRQNSESYVHSRADQQNINISYFLRWQRKSNYKN